MIDNLVDPLFHVFLSLFVVMEKSNEKENSDTDSSVVSSSDDEISIAEITGDDDALIL